MTVFVVTSRRPNADLGSKIAAVYPTDHHRFSDCVWFISSKLTTREVSDSIDVKREGFTGVIIMAATGSYYGVSNSNDWDWLKSAVERGDG